MVGCVGILLGPEGVGIPWLSVLTLGGGGWLSGHSLHTWSGSSGLGGCVVGVGSASAVILPGVVWVGVVGGVGLPVA